MRRFTRDGNDHYSLSFSSFKKKVSIRAARVVGPFEVVTANGLIVCPENWQGWLAFDMHGYPYPIDLGEFELIYELDEGAEAWVGADEEVTHGQT